MDIIATPVHRRLQRKKTENPSTKDGFIMDGLKFLMIYMGIITVFPFKSRCNTSVQKQLSW